MPTRNKHRWAKLRRALDPKRFHYVGLQDGRTIVYRGQNQFDWGPIDVDRVALRRLLGTLNGLKGTSIERVGRGLCEKFKKEYDEGKHRADPVTPEPASSTAGRVGCSNCNDLFDADELNEDGTIPEHDTPRYGEYCSGSNAGPAESGNAKETEHVI